jgi:hypothetical protein
MKTAILFLSSIVGCLVMSGCSTPIRDQIRTSMDEVVVSTLDTLAARYDEHPDTTYTGREVADYLRTVKKIYQGSK